jgi:TPP-dependent pyruvate/acetoin dehydrogenase alpha subunit
MISDKIFGAEELDELNKRSLEEIEDMLKYAMESPEPEPKDALKYIYAGREVEGR